MNVIAKSVIVGAIVGALACLIVSVVGCAHVQNVAAACAEPVTAALIGNVTAALDGENYELLLAKLGAEVLPCAIEAAVREVVASSEAVKAAGPRLALRAGRGRVWLAERAIAGQGG